MTWIGNLRHPAVAALLVAVSGCGHAPLAPAPSGGLVPLTAASVAGLKETDRLEVGSAPVTALAWLPSGAGIVTGDETGAVRVVAFDGSKPEPLGDDGEPIVAVAATGPKIAWGGAAGVIRAVGGGSARDVAEAPRGVFSLAATASGVLAAGTGEGTVLVFGERRYVLRGLDRAVSGVAFAPDGRRLVAIELAGRGQVWDGPKALSEFGYADGDRGGEMRGVAWLDANRVATGSEDGLVRIWDARRGSLIERLGAAPLAIRAVAVSPDRALLADVSDQGIVRVHDTTDFRPLAQVRIGGRLASLAFSPDGKRLVVAASDGSVRVLGVPRTD
jgi:WD40 repeat protein